jgi:hypothetical protein
VMRLRTGEALCSLVAVLAFLATGTSGCGSNPSSHDATSDSGEQASHWAGKTYVLDIPTKHWTRPSKDVGGEIAPFVPQFLFGLAGSASDLTVTVATGMGGVQTLCNPTQQASLSEAQYPNSQIVLSQFPMTFTEVNQEVTPNETISVHSTLHDLQFVNILPADSSSPEGTFTVTADLGELYKLFIKIQPQPPTLENVCSTLAAVDSPCGACSFKPEIDCLTIGAVQLTASPASVAVKQVSVADISASCP